MWQWFTVNAVWILIVAAAVLLLVLLVRHQVQEALKKATPKKWHKTLDKSIHLVVWITEGAALIVLSFALTATIVSKKGVAAIVTPETIQRWFLEHGVTVFIIIFFSYLLHRVSKLVIPEIVKRSVRVRGKGRRAREELAKRSGTLSSILAQIVGIIVIVVAMFMVLSEVGVDITPLLAGAGVAGIAIGFGAQSLIRDIVNGLFILLEDQYNKGDVVQIAGVWGLVEEVNLRRTVLRDLDGTVHSIPNGEVTKSSNYTKDWSRVNLNIPVAYGEDLEHVMQIINRVGNTLAEDKSYGPKILKAPESLRVDKFGDSGIEIKVLGDTKPQMQWEVTGELRKRLKKAFDEEGIEIPWPHVKLYYGKEKTDKVMACPTCAHPNLAGGKYCSNCGTSLGSD